MNDVQNMWPNYELIDAQKMSHGLARIEEEKMINTD